MRIDNIFDDNFEYAGYALYNKSQVVPIEKPEKDNLSDFSCIIITSYLHQSIIAEKLRMFGFKGRVITANPRGCLENKFGMEGLFRPIYD